MKTLLIYLLQLTVASGILYGYYHFFLRNKKFHLYNRYYLLAAAVISITIPFLQIPVYFTEAEAESSSVIKTLKILYYSGSEDEAIVTARKSTFSFDWNIFLYILYGTIASVLLIRILISLKKIRQIIKANKIEELNGVHFLNTEEPTAPFSFFRWLFWNSKIELRSEKGQQIFRHEVFHIQQKHSWDVIFMEVITMIFWINPFFHLIKKELRAIHEFLADQFAVNEEEKWNYAELLLMQALQTKQPLVNPFFHNQIKRRIAMITNPQKTSHRYLRKLLVLPLTIVVVTLLAFSYKKKTSSNENALTEPLTIVIDAGHGGIDPGTTSPDNKYTEHEITLAVAKTIQLISNEYNVKVVMTRQDNKLPGNASTKEEGIRKRVEITKEAKAELFISLHMNSAGTTIQDTRSGFEAFVSSKKEDQRNDQLATLILQSISDVYKTELAIKKRYQQGIYVLDQNVCPAVILECGYINNAKDLAFITDKANQEKLARKILEAIVDYKRSGNLENLIEVKDTTPVFNGNIKIEKLDPITKDRSSVITVNGNKFEVKEVKVEGLEEERLAEVKIETTGYKLHTDTTGQPLIIIDGVKQTDKNFKNIDPNTIESINVYKDKTLIAKYGNEGKNGVIEIFTKNNPNKEKQKLDEVVVVGYSSKNKNVFEKVEIEPAFPGGSEAWRKFLERNLNPNIPVDKGAPEGNYPVVVQFIVKTDGSITDVKTLTKHGYGMEEEAVRVIKSGPNWLPAIHNGNKVNAYRKQPITFTVIGEEKEGTNGSNLNEVVTIGYKKNNNTNNAQNEANSNLNKKIQDAQLKDTDKLSPIYPNPATNNITIVFNSQQEGKGEIRITDQGGNIKSVKQTTLIKGNNNIKINVASLPKGVYFVNVVDTNKSTARIYKMVKE